MKLCFKLNPSYRKDIKKSLHSGCFTFLQMLFGTKRFGAFEKRAPDERVANSIAVIKSASNSSDTVNFCSLRDPGGKGTPLYKLYRYVRRQMVWFCEPVWSEIGYRF